MGDQPEDRPALRTGGVNGAFVAVSEIAVPAEGADPLQDAFRDRLGEVDDWPGFRGLQVWRDRSDERRFVMVSWWSTETAFRDYMRSVEHRRSHARIDTGPTGPHPAGFDRFEVVAE